MNLQLFSIENAPTTLPIWELILDDLGRPPAERIARTLDVGVSTVYRWNQSGNAPKMACLSLFWLTRWGRSQVDCKATNDAMAAVGLVRSLQEERSGLRATVELLRQERDRLAGMVARFTALATQNAGHGSGAIDLHSRTGMALGGSWGDGRSEASAPSAAELPELKFPELVAPPPATCLSLSKEPVSPELGRLAKAHGRNPFDRRGSRAKRLQSSRSETAQGRQRNGGLPPAAHQEDEESKPLEESVVASCNHSATNSEDPVKTCFRWDKPSAARPGTAGAARPAVPSAPALSEPHRTSLSRGRAAAFGGDATPEPASQVNDTATAQAPTACGQLSGVPTPAPARSAFAALVAALSSTTTPESAE